MWSLPKPGYDSETMRAVAATYRRERRAASDTMISHGLEPGAVFAAGPISPGLEAATIGRRCLGVGCCSIYAGVSRACGIPACIELSFLIDDVKGLGASGLKLAADGDPQMHRIARLGTMLALLLFATAVGLANARAAATTVASSSLSAIDYNFVAQANLGAPFQVDSGRLAEKKADTAAVRDYAHLMVVTHIPVVNALNTILQRKGINAPPNTLLQGAYDAMISTLKADRGAVFDRDYVVGQVDYQKGNAALFQDESQNGNDPDIKEFARQTLPKIEDHLGRALRLAQGHSASN